MELNLKGKTALVTASSRGIGKAVAFGLSEEGCTVIMCSRNRKILRQSAREIQDRTQFPVIPFPVDLTDPESIGSLVKKIKGAFERVDILVNNVGGMPFKRHDEVADADWQESFDATFMSAFRVSGAFIPGMKQGGCGRIIFIASVAARQPGIIATNALRSAVAGYAKTLSNELGKDNILVNTVCPSYAVTDKFYQVADTLAEKNGTTREEIIASWMRDVPLKRPASAKEIANLVVFLASEKASYITGTCIQADGGFVRNLF